MSEENKLPSQSQINELAKMLSENPVYVSPKTGRAYTQKPADATDVKELADHMSRWSNKQIDENVKMAAVAARDISRGFDLRIPKGSKLTLTAGRGDWKYFLMSATGKGVKIPYGTVGLSDKDVTNVKLV